jgi:hypothetical protein
MQGGAFDRKTTPLGSRIARLLYLLTGIVILANFSANLHLSTDLLQRLPTWDEATHGVDGIILTEALLDLNPLKFFKEFFSMSYWPPGFPLMQVPAYSIFGYDYAVGRWFMRLLALVSLVVVFWLSKILNGKQGFFVSLAVMGIIALSGEFLHFSNLIMLEVPSTLFLLLSLGLYMAHLEKKTSSLRYLKLSLASATILFFCKFNYWVLWMACLIGFHFSLNLDDLKQIGFEAKDYIQKKRWRDGFHVFVILYLFVTLLTLVTGGWDIFVGETRINLKFNGNALYALAVIIFLRSLLFRRKDFVDLKGWILSLRQEYQIFFFYVILPVVLWFLNPSNFKTFVSFIINESTTKGRVLSERLMFYPEAFLHHYVPDPLIGFGVFGLATVPLILWPRLLPSQRIFLIATWVGIVACVAHPNHDPRYIFPYAIMLILSAGLGVSCLIPAKIRFLQPALALGLAGFYLTQWPQKEHATRLEGAMAPITIEALADKVCDLSQYGRKNIFIGYYYDYSPSLSKWSCRQDNIRLSPEKIPKTITHLRIYRNYPQWDRLLEDQSIDQVLVLHSQEPNPDFIKFRQWQAPLVEQLDQHHNFQQLKEVSIDGTPFKLVVYHSATKQNSARE